MCALYTGKYVLVSDLSGMNFRENMELKMGEDGTCRQWNHRSHILIMLTIAAISAPSQHHRHHHNLVKLSHHHIIKSPSSPPTSSTRLARGALWERQRGGMVARSP